MRNPPLLYTLILSTIRPTLSHRSSALIPSSAIATSVPALEYPICRRNFTCAAPWKQDFGTVMSDLRSPASETIEDGVQKIQAPIENEVEILAEAGARKPEVTGKDGDKAAAKDVEVQEAVKLPPLSAAEFRAYNSMAEHMEYFHNHFRQTWTMIYTSCTNNKRPAHMSLKTFIATGLQLIGHLTVHHSIEEQSIFPVLATRMPEFRAGKNAAELLRQHREIHKGMDAFEAYLKKCRAGETELELRVLKKQMDDWGDVLWTHLDQEVETLKAENMRKYWTVEEMRRMPM